MIVSIQQPSYLPWTGLLHRIAQADLHVWLDTVQFDRSGYNHRNRIRTRDGWCWLTVPVLHPTMVPFEAVRVDSRRGWQERHWALLQQHYRQAPYFWSGSEWLKEVGYGTDWRYLTGLCDATTAWLLRKFRIATPTAWASRMELGAVRKSDLILTICREVGATVYLSGPGGRDYLHLAAFERAAIEMRWHEYEATAYAQCWPGWEPNLSAVDLLFNHGPEAKDILLEGDEPSKSW